MNLGTRLRYGARFTDLNERLALHDCYPIQRLHEEKKEGAIQEECDQAVQSILELCLPDPVVEAPPLPPPSTPPSTPPEC